MTRTLRRMKSRLTMKPLRFLYRDIFDGKEVWLYKDCYNVLWMANKNYIPFWDCRIVK